MINKVSLLLSERIGLSLNSSDDEKAVYAYGIEVLLGLFLNFVVLFSVAYFMNKMAELLVFFIFLAGLKAYAGGYHSDSHIGCVSLSLFSFLTSVIAGVYMRPYGEMVLILGLLFSVLMVFRLAPVDTKNKPLSKSERKKYKVVSRAIVVALSFAAVILYFLKINDHIYITAVTAMVIESVSLLKK